MLKLKPSYNCNKARNGARPIRTRASSHHKALELDRIQYRVRELIHYGTALFVSDMPQKKGGRIHGLFDTRAVHKPWSAASASLLSARLLAGQVYSLQPFVRECNLHVECMQTSATSWISSCKTELQRAW